jgi:hypothetical protein
MIFPGNPTCQDGEDKNDKSISGIAKNQTKKQLKKKTYEWRRVKRCIGGKVQ